MDLRLLRFYPDLNLVKKSVYVMRSMKKDHKSVNVNFKIVKYVVHDCLTNILKKSRPKSAKMAELGYFDWP